MTVAALPHGTPSCYTNHGCRRPECRAAASAYRAQLRAQNPEKYRAAQRRYRESNREKVRAQRARHRARKRAERDDAATAQHAASEAAAGPLLELIEARERHLAVVIARAPYSLAAREAKIRRAETRALLEVLRREVTA